jgi:hypothetical protein
MTSGHGMVARRQSMDTSREYGMLSGKVMVHDVTSVETIDTAGLMRQDMLSGEHLMQRVLRVKCVAEEKATRFADDQSP